MGRQSTIAKPRDSVTPNDGRKGSTIGFQDRGGDRRRVRLAAAALNESVSDFMRRVTLGEVTKVLREHGIAA